MNNHRAIVIAGPTASGKSEVAMAVAQALDGEIVNADSMQVYEGLDILTAKPGKSAQSRIPHHLYSNIKPDQPFSVADWLVLARQSAEKIQNAGHIPIFVGGTGLYFRALLKGIAAIPEIPARTRDAVRKQLEKKGSDDLHAQLQKIDPESASRIKPGDSQRILRALEVYKATGKPISQWQTTEHLGLLSGNEVVMVCLESSPETLEARIRKRLGLMVQSGALAEVKALAAHNISTDMPVMKAIGVRPLMRHLDGECGIEEAIEQTVIESRQYAKRQRTWFRNQFADWSFITADDEAAKSIVLLAKKVFSD